MAEAIFNQLARSDGVLDHFDISSAGTKDWDIGMKPDRRTRQILEKHGYPLDPDKRARRITQGEKQKADYLIAMSGRIADDLGKQETVYLLMDFVEDAAIKNIPDPYPTDTFPQAFELILRGTKAFYNFIRSTEQIKRAAK